MSNRIGTLLTLLEGFEILLLQGFGAIVTTRSGSVGAALRALRDSAAAGAPLVVGAGWRGPCSTVPGVGKPGHRDRRWCMHGGASLLEVMATFGVAAGLMFVGLLEAERSTQVALAAARRDLVDDLRRARMQATLRGARMRFEARGGRYVITRLSDADADGVWEQDPSFAPRQVELPAGLSVSASSHGTEAVAEFDGRGLLVPRGDGCLDSIAVTVSDRSGRRELLQIWPSGQIEKAAASIS